MKSRTPNNSRRRKQRSGVRWRQHAWCMHDSLRRLGHRPLGSALTIAVMGLALALPLVFYMLLANVQQFASVLGDSQSINVFLKSGLGAERAATLAQNLRDRPDVASVTVRTPQQGLSEMAALQGFGDAVQTLSSNPLPFVLLVEPSPGIGRAAVASLASAMRAMPQVDLAQDNGQWRVRLDALVVLGQRVAWVLALLLAAAAVLVIGNTVRLDIRGRTQEIAVQQLVGAEPSFVRRPFLYEGIWYGAGAGVVAVLLALLLEAALAAPVRALVASYAGSLHIGGLPWSILVCAIAGAVVLGWLGAWISSSWHIARPSV